MSLGPGNRTSLSAPLVVVIGHERCGAVEATLESIQHNSEPHGDMGALVEGITPAVPVAEQRRGDLVENTIRVNTEMSRDAIAKSSLLADRLKAGEVKVLAAYYSLDDGRVTQL